MSEPLRRTVRAFLRWERPNSRDEAITLVRDWFGRYDPSPGLLEQEVERHFDAPPARPWWSTGSGRGLPGQ